MNKTVIYKIRLIMLLALVMMVSIWTGIFAFGKAEAVFMGVGELSLTIDGGSIIVEGDEGVNGLKFTLSLPDDEYEALKSSVGENKDYKAMETGLIIVPSYYNEQNPINYDTLFGENAIYDWANWDSSIYNYVYTGSKTRIININANNWIKNDGCYTYSGAIIDVLEENEDELFYAVGYVKLIDGAGIETVKFSDGTIASVVATAMNAIAGDTLDQAQIDWIKNNWIGTINSATGEGVPLINVDDYAGKLSYADLVGEGCENYNLFKGFGDSSNVKVYLTDENGNSKIISNKEGIIDGNNEANLRLWSIEITCGDYSLWSGKADLYSPRFFLWNDDTSSNSIVAYEFRNILSVNYKTTVTNGKTDVTINGESGVSFNKTTGNGTWYVWKPVHTQEYYSLFTGKGIALSMTLTADASEAKTQGSAVLNQGYIYGKDGYIVEPKVTTSITSHITIDKIVENWSIIIDANWDSNWSTRRSFGMMHVYNIKNGGKVIVSGLKPVVEGINSVVQGQEYLVDLDKVADMSSVDIASYISASEIEKILEYSSLGFECRLDAISTSHTIAFDDLYSADLTGIKEVPYTLSVSVWGEPIYTTVIDFYSSSKTAVWANDLNANTVKAGRSATSDLGWSGKTITDLALGEGYEIVDASTVTDTTSPLYGKTGKFVKLTAVNANEQMTYSVIPLHTKAYYKELLSNKDYVLTFDVYVTGSFIGMSAIGAYYNKDIRYREYATWRGTNPDTNKWVTYSIPFDSYLLCDSPEDSFSNQYFDFNNIGTKVSSQNTLFQFEASSIGSTVYIGLPYVDTMPGYVHSSTTEKSVDLLGMSTYDLTELFSEKELKQYNYYGEKYGFDKIFYKVKLQQSYTTTIWANQKGQIILDLNEVVGTNESGVSITVFDLICLGAFDIDGYICDHENFPGHTGIGVFGEKPGCNNNQLFVRMRGISFTNRPDQIEVYEIAVADATLKMLRENYSTKLMSESNVEGNVQSICVNNVQDLTKSLTINAFKNETEAAQIQIVTKANLGEYKLIFADLRSGNNVLAKDNFSAYHLLYTNVVRNAAGAVNPTGLGEYPDAMLPMDVALANRAATISAGKNQGVWVSLSVPASQPAGVYTGTFRLQLGASVYEVPVKVTVYDYAVDEEIHMKTAFSLSYTNINNLETPYEYDENGNLIVNSSGNKNNTVSQEVIDAYIEYFTSHKLSTSPVVASSSFFGSWQGYPYDPNSLFSFDRVMVKGKMYYSYEWPLRSKDSNGNTVLNPYVVNKTGYDTHGYPLYLDRVDTYFNELVELADNPGVTYYTLPTYQAQASNFNYENVTDPAMYPKGWAGQMSEIRDEMPNGDKAYVINQLVLRDYIEIFFKKTIELHKSGKSVDVFKKAALYPTWIDEFGISASKTHNAQYLLKYMKTYFPDCSNWLKRVYANEIGNDQFLLGVLDSLANIKIGVTTNTIKEVDPSEHYANLIPVLGYFNSESGREDINNWMNTAYGGNAEKWVYTAGNVFPESSNNIDQPYITNRIIGWIMSEYDIEGYLYWATMCSKYMDGIVSSTIESVVGEKVKDGDIIKLDDFYNNAIHYGGVAGDGFLMYPGQYYGVTGPIGTIRVEALTDAVEDYNLFYDLKAMYKDAGIGDSYYTAMRRLCEMLYTGVKSKVPEGYTSDFQISRDALANMLIMARDNRVFSDDVYYDAELGKWVFTVIAPKDIENSVKSSIDATFISSTDLTLYDTAGVKMVFEVSKEFIDAGYVSISYDGKTINLSIETLVETAEVEALEWAEVDESNTTTYHVTYYSNGANKTSVNSEIVTLSEENAVGGRTSGRYYHVSPVNYSTANLGFSVLPTSLTKEDVKNYIGKAQLMFDIYMETTNIADGSIRDTYKVWYKLGKATNSQSNSNSWITVTIDFQQIYDNWDTLMNTNPASFTGANDDWSTSKRALFAVNGDSHSAKDVHTTTYYMGNFRIGHV